MGLSGLGRSGQSRSVHDDFVVDLGRNTNAPLELGQKIETAYPGQSNERRGIRNDRHERSLAKVRLSSSNSVMP